MMTVVAGGHDWDDLRWRVLSLTAVWPINVFNC